MKYIRVTISTNGGSDDEGKVSDVVLSFSSLDLRDNIAAGEAKFVMSRGSRDASATKTKPLKSIKKKAITITNTNLIVIPPEVRLSLMDVSVFITPIDLSTLA